MRPVDASRTSLAAYVLAIESIPERVADAKALVDTLRKLAVADPVRLFPALYWKDEQAILDYLARYPQHTFTPDYLERMLAGQLAVTLSHIRIWRTLLEEGHGGALVFEDDNFICDAARFKEIVEQLRRGRGFEWVRIQLHREFREEVVNRRSLLDRIFGRRPGPLFVDDPMPYGFAGYYVSRSGARKMLQCCENIDAPIDWLPPSMKQRGLLDTRCVTEVVVDHHPFEGSKTSLEKRHKVERLPHKLQKSASTIWTSPRVAERPALHRFVSRLGDRQ